MSIIPAFDRFVQVNQPRKAQLPGLIAYSIYKAAKREWTIEESARKGRSLFPAESASYLSTLTPTSQRSYEADAAEVLTAFAQEVIDAERKNIIADALSDTFWVGVKSGILAAFCYSLILLFFSFVLAIFGVDIVEVPHKVFTYLHPPEH